MVSNSTPDGRHPAILSIQYLRAIAAFFVVIHHAIAQMQTLDDSLVNVGIFKHGVDIFFVISGFIMFISARREMVSTFLRRRIERIVPLYWLATLIFVGMDALWLEHELTAEKLKNVALAFFFVPHFHALEPNYIYPPLIPGWTLNYEMAFYAIFAIGLAARRVLAVPCLVIIGAILIGLIVQPSSAVGRTYTDYLMIEFVIGLIIGKLFTLYRFRKMEWLLPVGIALFASTDLLDLPIVLTAGTAAVLIVIGALALDQRGLVPGVPAMKLLGDASYAIYLFHIPVEEVATRSLAHLPISGTAQFVALAIFSVVGSAVIGCLVHLYLEKPMLGWFAQRRRAARIRTQVQLTPHQTDEAV